MHTTHPPTHTHYAHTCTHTPTHTTTHRPPGLLCLSFSSHPPLQPDTHSPPILQHADADTSASASAFLTWTWTWIWAWGSTSTSPSSPPFAFLHPCLRPRCALNPRPTPSLDALNQICNSRGAPSSSYLCAWGRAAPTLGVFAAARVVKCLHLISSCCGGSRRELAGGCIGALRGLGPTLLHRPAQACEDSAVGCMRSATSSRQVQVMYCTVLHRSR